jgi:hypothetical protein
VVASDGHNDAVWMGLGSLNNLIVDLEEEAIE